MAYATELNNMYMYTMRSVMWLIVKVIIVCDITS
jgi:hypothetical protein